MAGKVASTAMRVNVIGVAPVRRPASYHRPASAKRAPNEHSLPLLLPPGVSVWNHASGFGKVPPAKERSMRDWIIGLHKGAEQRRPGVAPDDWREIETEAGLTVPQPLRDLYE